MTLIDDIEKSLIEQHIREPSELTLYMRDFSQLVFRAIREDSREAQIACLSGMTTSMAWMLALHLDPEVFLEEFNQQIRAKTYEVKLIYAQAELELTNTKPN